MRENADTAKNVLLICSFFRERNFYVSQIFTSQNQIFHKEKHLFFVHIFSYTFFSYTFFLLEHNGVLLEHNGVLLEHNGVFSEHNEVFPEHNGVLLEQNAGWDRQKYEEKVGLCMNWVLVSPNRL